MSHDEILAFVRRSLEEIAPDVDTAELTPGDSLRDELDLDSMDFLALVRAIHAELGVDVPERDYPAIDSLEGCAGYIAARLADA